MQATHVLPTLFYIRKMRIEMDVTFKSINQYLKIGIAILNVHMEKYVVQITSAFTVLEI